MKDECSIICVSTFSSQWDADMARMALETHGIDSFVSADDGGGTRPYLQLATGVRLMVRETESKQAKEIIETLKSTQGDELKGETNE